jgi:hypothetical protein
MQEDGRILGQLNHVEKLAGWILDQQVASIGPQTLPGMMNLPPGRTPGILACLKFRASYRHYGGASQSSP